MGPQKVETLLQDGDAKAEVRPEAAGAPGRPRGGGRGAVAPAQWCARPEAPGPSGLAKALCTQDVSSGLWFIWMGSRER